jgi:hypothetical protein
MKRILMIAVLFPAVCSAEILVRHCDTPTATACAVAPIWVQPPSAINVQVNRVGAPFVKLSEVQPTERVAACYDDPAVTAGSTRACSTRVPGRNDLWQLKSVLFPSVAPGALTLTVATAQPKWDTGAPLSSSQLTDLTVRLYGAEQGQGKVPLASAQFATSVAFRRESTSVAIHCFDATLWLDMNGDKVFQAEEESTHSAEWCGQFGSVPVTLRLSPPDSITGATQ